MEFDRSRARALMSRVEPGRVRRQRVVPLLRRDWSEPAMPRSQRESGLGPELSPVWEAAGHSQLQQSVIARDLALRQALAASDFVTTYLALFLVLRWFAHGSIHLRIASLLLLPFVLLAAKAIGLYDRDQHMVRKTTIDEIPSLLYLAVLFALTVWLTEAVVLRGWLTRPQVFGLLSLAFGFLVAGRLITRSFVASRVPPERCLIIGDSADGERIMHKLGSSPGVNAVVLGRVALRSSTVDTGRMAALSILDRPSDLAEQIAKLQVDRVIVAPGGHDEDEVLHLIRLVKVFGVRLSVLPRLLEVVGSASTFEDIDGLTLLGVRHYGVGAWSAMLKRAMDVIGSAAGIVLLAPLLAMLAIAVKVDSPSGSVFFRQRRIGRRGDVFSMTKFRSMVPNAEFIKADLANLNEAEGGLFKITDDPRITRVGRFLRTTSLDELPQLFNVLAGSMSLVGPRPLVLDEDALIEGWERRRLAVKPGMTGMWQIFGSSRIPMPEMVRIDYLYGANWSLWLDLKILIRTVPYVLRRRGL
jgi:exopolysaccharide biosynthesis polyprenyl glycosylphosphotransferase